MRALAFSLLVLLAPVAAQAADPVHRLSLGDPARRDKDVTLVLDAVVDTATGETLGPEELAARLDTTRLLLLGESHTSVESHRVQLQVLRALARLGRVVRVGLEMFPYTEQTSLDSWNAGRWSETEFVDKSRWYEHWGYHWGYYRDVLLFARTQGIPIAAVNAPRDLVAAVRKTGIAGLSAQQAARMPPKVDTESADHLVLFKAQVGGGDALHGGMTDDAWKGMQAAQATWDAAMAWNAVQALKAVNDPNAIMVVLVGSGHVAYGLGIERQARTWFDGRVASVIAMPITDDKGPTGPVRASYANFLWGVAREQASAWPSFGLSTRVGEGGRRPIIDIEKDSPAAQAGLKVGDVIVKIDEVAIDSREAMSRQMASYNWGDTPRVTIARGTEQLIVTVALRRAP
ncbi:MAG: ChaN family lipoprotein [Vicinamibacteria bacterium]|nr:ChaN family lipoprotein [Vicinamibacteria bacterium]